MVSVRNPGRDWSQPDPTLQFILAKKIIDREKEEEKKNLWKNKGG